MSQSLRIQDIRAIVQRYFDNTCTDDELSLVHYWYTLLGKLNYDLVSPVMTLEQRIWEKLSFGR